ncbi:hypothetical protein F5878DRAFT_723090, partial [Lentinula raphanica]
MVFGARYRPHPEPMCTHRITRGNSLFHSSQLQPRLTRPTNLTRVPQSKRLKVILGDTPVAVFIALLVCKGHDTRRKQQVITSSPLSTPSSLPIAPAVTPSLSTEATASSSSVAATSYLTTTTTNTAAS